MKRVNASPALKKQSWETYIGIGIKETRCPLCMTHRINQSTNSGFEAAHIVSAKFIDELSVFYIYPSCKSCNNEMQDVCLLDQLYCRGRYAELRKTICAIYSAFISLNTDALPTEDRIMWRVLEHLYGPARFPAGGGLVNRRPIYEMARAEQLRLLSEQLMECSRQTVGIIDEMRRVNEMEVKLLSLNQPL